MVDDLDRLRLELAVDERRLEELAERIKEKRVRLALASVGVLRCGVCGAVVDVNPNP